MLQKSKDLFLKYRDPISIFFITRVGIFLLAFFAVQLIIGPRGPEFWHAFPGNLFLDPWAKWDSNWYRSIVDGGYFYQPGQGGNIVFFPLYPIVVWLFKMVFVDTFLTGIILSNLCFFFSLILFYELVKGKFDEMIAYRATFYLSIFPGALFFSAMYSESLFLLVSLLVFCFLEKEDYLWSGVFAALASAARPIGIVFFLVLLVSYLRSKGFSLARIRSDIMYVLIAPLGLLSFLLFQYIKFGNPLTFIEAERYGWGARFSWPWDVLISACSDGRLAFNVLLTLVFFFLCFIVHKRLGITYSLYLFLCIIVPLSVINFNAMNRYLAVLFPAFIGLAIYGENKITDAIVITMSLLFLSLSVVLFSNWYWAG